MAGLIGCASGGSDAAMEPGPGDDEAIRIVVRNDHPQTMLVYAYTGTMRTQIGTVRANDAVVFRVPESMLEAGDAWVMQFHVGIFGGPDGFRTDEMIMRRGDEVRLRVAANLRMSTWSRN